MYLTLSLLLKLSFVSVKSFTIGTVQFHAVGSNADADADVVLLVLVPNSCRNLLSSGGTKNVSNDIGL